MASVAQVDQRKRDEAREDVLRVLGTDSDEIVFRETCKE
jgi:hypothetical protein